MNNFKIKTESSKADGRNNYSLNFFVLSVVIGRFHGMEMSMENSKVMRISEQPSPVQIMIDKKQL
jgi:hypothetical protein